jgi:hypothetical protein
LQIREGDFNGWHHSGAGIENGNGQRCRILGEGGEAAKKRGYSRYFTEHSLGLTSNTGIAAPKPDGTEEFLLQALLVEVKRRSLLHAGYATSQIFTIQLAVYQLAVWKSPLIE